MSFGSRTFAFLTLFTLLCGAWPAQAHAPSSCPENSTQQLIDESFIPLCVSVCDRAFENKSEKMTGHFAKSCRIAKQKEESRDTLIGAFWGVADIVDQSLLKCLPLATEKSAVGAYEFVKSLPYLVSQMTDAIARASSRNQLPAGLKESFGKCDGNSPCRVAIARGLLQYQQTDDSGKPLISDADVESAIKGRSLDELLRAAGDNRERTRAECARDLAKIRKTVNPLGSEWTTPMHEQVYSEMATRHTLCLGALRLYPPVIAPDETPKGQQPKRAMDRLTKRQQLLVGSVCLGEEFTTEFCAEIVQALIPLPLIGPQTSMLSKAAAAKGALAPAQAAAKSGAVHAVEAAAATGAGETKSGSAAAAKPVAESVVPSTTGTASTAKGADRPVASTAVRAETSSETSAGAHLEVTARSDAAAGARQKLIERYNERVFSTEAQNRSFIEAAGAAEKTSTGSRFLDVENSVMKTLNDVTGDKNLITSLTNRHKDIMIRRMNELMAKHPDLKLDVYSDFKSVKVAISGFDKLSPTAQTELRQEIQAALIASNKEFGGDVRQLGLQVPKAGEPEKWFRGGFGATVDEAALAARRARQLEGERGFADFASADVKDKMASRLGEIERQRQALAGSPAFRSLLDRTGVPRADVFDLTRKYESAEGLAQAVRERYRLTNFSVADAERLQAYGKGVDEFSPTILIPKRETVNLDGALKGGATADFLGMGSANQQATARGIASAGDLGSALRGARAGEREVTRVFRAKMERFREIVGQDVKCSGDDCVQIASAAMSGPEKLKMVNAVAGDPKTRGVRMSFVGPNVATEHRMQLATHGESIEKALRKEIGGSIAASKLQKITFGLDMQSTVLNEGQVTLLIGRAPGTMLSERERRTLNEAFARALEKYNQSRSSYVPGNAYTVDQKFRFVVGPGILNLQNGEER